MGDCAIMLNILKLEQPELMKYLGSKGFDIFLNNLLYKWFVSLFVENNNIETFYCIWDALFCFGNIAFFKAVVGIMIILKPDILRATSYDQISQVFEEKIAKFGKREIEKITKFILEDNHIEMCDVIKLRKVMYPEVFETIKKTKSNNTNQEEYECYLDYPYCLKEFKKCHIKNALVTRLDEELLIQEDFLDGNNVNEKIRDFRFSHKKNSIQNINDDSISKKEKLINKIKTYSNLLIERNCHSTECRKSRKNDIIENSEFEEGDDIKSPFDNSPFSPSGFIGSNHSNGSDILKSSLENVNNNPLLESSIMLSKNTEEEAMEIIRKIDKSETSRRTIAHLNKLKYERLNKNNNDN